MGGLPGLEFRVRNIPVRIELWFILTAFLLATDRPFKYILTWMAVVFVSVLVHELGHAYAYRRLHQEPRIVLTWLVGLTYGSETINTRNDRIKVALAGSVTQLVVLGIPAWLLFDYSSLPDNITLAVILYDMVTVSVGWAIFNLLPILPLDGAHISEAIYGRYKTRYISIVTGVLATIWVYTSPRYGFAWFIPFILTVFNAIELYQVSKGTPSIAFLPDAPGTGWDSGPDEGLPRDKRKRRRRGRGHLRAVPVGHEEIPVGLGAARPGERTGPDAQQVEALAWESLRRNDVPAASRALSRHPNKDAADPFLVASVDLASGDVGDGIARFRTAYLAKPDGPASLVPATLIAQAGRAAELAGVLLADRTSSGPHAATSLQNHLHYAKQYEAAARVGELIHDDGRASKAQTAFETACSWAQAGDPDKGLDWLRRAVSDGFTAASMIDGEPDLAPVRALPAFDELRSRLA